MQLFAYVKTTSGALDKGSLFLVPVNSRSPKWAGGRQKREIAGETQRWALDDPNWSQIARLGNAIFAPLETNGRTDGNQKNAPLT